jgi:hypothetical protein
MELRRCLKVWAFGEFMEFKLLSFRLISVEKEESSNEKDSSEDENLAANNDIISRASSFIGRMIAK